MLRVHTTRCHFALSCCRSLFSLPSKSFLRTRDTRRTRCLRESRVPSAEGCLVALRSTFTSHSAGARQRSSGSTTPRLGDARCRLLLAAVAVVASGEEEHRSSCLLREARAWVRLNACRSSSSLQWRLTAEWSLSLRASEEAVVSVEVAACAQATLKRPSVVVAAALPPWRL
jgi:hypothetical protein